MSGVPWPLKTSGQVFVESTTLPGLLPVRFTRFVLRVDFFERSSERPSFYLAMIRKFDGRLTCPKRIDLLTCWFPLF